MVARILSRSSTFEESEDEESLVRRSEIERKLNLRRILMLLAIVLVFVVAASILLFCVAYEIKKQEELGLMVLDDIVCSANDVACIANLCPTGMTWQPERNQCSEDGGATRVGRQGLSPSDPALCRSGYVWVSWRQRCMIRAGWHLFLYQFLL